MDLIVRAFIPPPPLITNCASYIKANLPNLENVMRIRNAKVIDFPYEKFRCTSEEFLVHHDLNEIENLITFKSTSNFEFNESNGFIYEINLGKIEVGNHNTNFKRTNSKVPIKIFDIIESELNHHDIEVIDKSAKQLLIKTKRKLGNLATTSLIEETSVSSFWPEDDESKEFRKIYNHIVMAMHQYSSDESHINGIWIEEVSAGALPPKKEISIIDILREPSLNNDWELWFKKLHEIDSLIDQKNKTFNDIYLTTTDKILLLNKPRGISKLFKKDWVKVWNQIK
ncbi:hypothetical protein [Taylorella equigenitalis]|uniref:Uncharacterized protein n=1 Tax=Taylorella equigenitalis ATCC 35865 TaxID=743973 RepID=A0ABN4AVA5_9BURK|nr:hypothetical protein [Taylorella equigenitalis]AFN35731.1 hypothetical protein KUI_0649 [Taylorella equigenitalis ATCC 35865]ASY39150.1 hypothetical protein CA604_03235 [Taylorella equigenitalis]ASY40668.1 hypothetical protein CAV20_03060 [Taylorella equigenitalis]WDU49963.1 hypothetical protein KNO34_03090 [Taylorella equigenitalis]WDU52436.1 hypothetical protein KNO32_03080 [Taylorella equigenitalis]